MRRSLCYRCGIICFTTLRLASIANKPFDQLGQLEEVRERHQHSAAADH
jgi:hypothetical protein